VISNKTIGILGLGLVGMALAKRLVGLGYNVHGFDIAPEVKAQALAAEVTWHNEPQGLVSHCDVVLFAVLDDAALRTCADVVTSDSKPLGKLKLVVSCVTASQKATLEAAAKVAAQNIAFVDLPLLGSSQQIERGEAIGLLGADAETFNTWCSLLVMITPNLRHVGGVGLGVAAKLTCNLILGLNRSALAEGMALAKGFGIDPKLFLSLLQGSPAYSKAVDVAGPRMATRDFDPVSRIHQHRKDVGLILEAMQEHGIKSFLGAAQAALLDEAIEQGLGNLDNVAVIAAYDVKKEADQ
jgi:3-hydroxyisobutyrate dehydrogenase-like beta-hydroxyacid dehydrogenase